MSNVMDALISQALKRGAIIVDPDTGAIYNADGARAEIPAEGYGRVQVHARPRRLAMAHRVVWIAVKGAIPDNARVRHANRKRFDNRPDNLELVFTRPRVHNDPGRGAPGALGAPFAPGATPFPGVIYD